MCNVSLSTKLFFWTEWKCTYAPGNIRCEFSWMQIISLWWEQYFRSRATWTCIQLSNKRIPWLPQLHWLHGKGISTAKLHQAKCRQECLKFDGWMALALGQIQSKGNSFSIRDTLWKVKSTNHLLDTNWVSSIYMCLIPNCYWFFTPCLKPWRESCDDTHGHVYS